MITEFLQQTLQPNDIFILSSYGAAVVVMIALAAASWQSKKHAENDLRRLKQQISELLEKQE